MGKVYVERDGQNNIISVNAMPQPGGVNELVDDQDVGVQTFINPPIPTEDEQIDKAFAENPILKGLCGALAARFGVTEAQIRAEVKQYK